MRYFLTVICCMVSLSSFAEEPYTPPTVLTKAEASAAKTALQKAKKSIQQRWATRLTIAQQHNKLVAQPGSGLKRPYYGDHLITK